MFKNRGCHHASSGLNEGQGDSRSERRTGKKKIQGEIERPEAAVEAAGLAPSQTDRNPTEWSEIESSKWKWFGLEDSKLHGKRGTRVKATF